MMMLMKLSGFWLGMAIICVGVGSYFIALTIDGVFGKDGFGTVGNMVVLTAGFFGGIAGYEWMGYNLTNLQYSTFVGVGGALLTFTCLAGFKVIVDKVMH
jgi:hypothetical protein